MREGVCVYSPYPTGGMPLYVAELLGAITGAAGSVDGEGGPSVEWLSSTDLDRRFLDGRYVVHPVLPAIRDASQFRTRIGYVVSRVLHHVRRDRRFLAWVRSRADIGAVHVQETPTLLPHLVVRLLRRRGTGVLVTVHNVRRHDYPPFLRPATVDRWLRRTYLDSDCLFVHSRGLADELERFLTAGGACTVPPIRVVPHGIWSTTAVPERIGEQRPAGRRLLFFGTIRRNKGLHLLLEAAARGDLAGYRITVAGEVAEPDHLDQIIVPLVEKARAAGVVIDLRPEFVPDDEVAALCAAHDVLVLPYTEDFVAQSGAAFMGLAHGLPIVATRSGALGELMTEHRIGVLAAAATPSAIAAAVHELCTLPEDGVAALADGMRRAAETLTWGGMAATTVAEYRRVLSRGRTPVARGGLR
ncbi:hypothetical protein GCM10009613_14910 [Pseudonocardia kongjuensis]|uniref:Glycosyltransferase involved in cell wall biosynthesis n=1 Tax=Pseudonocardia kongjuensis TaxID=102227 RepID=A0ABN1XKT3_9PSEU